MKIFIAIKPFNNKIYYQNNIFNTNSAISSFYLIAARKLLAKKNIQMDTMDVVTHESRKDVYMDVPYPWELQYWIRILKNRKKSILFTVEPPIINPFNFMKKVHRLFSKIYTWNDDFVDNIKYFKYQIPVETKRIKTKRIPYKNRKLLVMMNINWLPFLPFKLLSLGTTELYTKRIQAIDFFDKYYPTDFSLYGIGWNRPQRFSIKQKFFGYRKYKVYKGKFPQKEKYNILSNYKFCLCFENNYIAGNISEKIIDCFKAGCVPIYFGAPNINDHISAKCFIDFREFKNYKELVEFLNTVDEKTYNRYVTEIDKFLASAKFKKIWSEDTFAKVFLQNIV